MEIEIESLIPFDALQTDIDKVFAVVEKNGKVILLKNDRPAYIIFKYETNLPLDTNLIQTETTKYTLQEAMRIVLSEAEDNTMHASSLADEIYDRKLYRKKDGGKAKYNQIRARVSHYPDLFEALPGNYIKLKDEIFAEAGKEEE